MAYIFGSIWDRFNRNALNDLSKKVETHGKSIQDLVAEGQLSPEQYAELITIINSYLKSGEVGKFDLTPELRLEVNRISEKINKGEVSESDFTGTLQTLVNSIPNKINHGNVSIDDININQGKFDQTFLSEDLLKQIAGNAPINAVPADASITSQKLAENAVDLNVLDFTNASSNLFNRGDIINGKSINPTTGEPSDNEAFNLSGFIRVSPNASYSMFDVGRWGLYRSDYTFISSNVTQNITTTPETFFIRVGVSNTRLGTAQLNRGGLKAYEPYAVNLDISEKTGLVVAPSTSTVDNNALTTNAVDPSQTLFFRHPRNKFNKNNVEMDVRIENENTVPDALFVTTKDFVAVKPSTRYSTTGSSVVGFYDEHKRFISRYSPSASNPYYDTPPNCHYNRFSVAKSYYETYMVNEGALLPFEPFIYKLQSTPAFPIEIPEGSGSGGGSVDTTLTYSDKIISEYSETYSGELSAGSTQLVATINGSLLSKEIYMSTNDLHTELVIEVLMDGGTYKPYKLLANDGSGEVPITIDNLTIHGSTEFLISSWDIIEKQYAFNLREKQFANGIKVSVKNNGGTSVNASVRVSGGKYA